MVKLSQSVFDLLHVFMRDNMSPELTNKEAQILYDLWKSGKRSHSGRITVSSSINPIEISSLQTKGYLESSAGRVALSYDPTVSFTAKGKEVIKNIVLFAEKSALETKDEKINYDDIYRSMKFGPAKKANKVACKLEKPETENWLQKIAQHT